MLAAGLQRLVVLVRLQLDDSARSWRGYNGSAASMVCNPSEQTALRIACRSQARCSAAMRCCACLPGKSPPVGPSPPGIEIWLAHRPSGPASLDRRRPDRRWPRHAVACCRPARGSQCSLCRRDARTAAEHAAPVTGAPRCETRRRRKRLTRAEQRLPAPSSVPASGRYGKSGCLGGSRDAPRPGLLHSARRQWTGEGEGQALAKLRDVKRTCHGSFPV